MSEKHVFVVKMSLVCFFSMRKNLTVKRGFTLTLSHTIDILMFLREAICGAAPAMHIYCKRIEDYEDLE